MKNSLLQRATKLNKNRKHRKGWQAFVRMLAICVVFCTTYVLILPAITIQADPVCGFEEHAHTQACYQQPQAEFLGCGLPAGAIVVHQHDELCYGEGGELLCAIPEAAVHTHENACYALTEELVCEAVHVHSDACSRTESVLICTQEESEDHTHGDECYSVTEIPCAEPVTEHEHNESCYQQTLQLICTVPELQLHVHEDGCYGENGALICELPVVVEHQHTQSCLVLPEEAASVLICTLEEHIHETGCYPVEDMAATQTGYFCGFSVHAHNEDCYDADGNLICTIPAHEHEASCIVKDLDLTADVDSAWQWEIAAKAADRTGDWAEDLLAVAKTQLGYQESSKNVALEGDDLKGYTYYGAKYGDPYGDWDALFVSFCLEYAGVKDFPAAGDPAQWRQQLEAQQMFAPIGAFAPDNGDLIFVDADLDGEADRVGIAAEQVPGTDQWKLIVGDTENGCVEYITYALTDEVILGGCDLPENPMSQEDRDQAVAVRGMVQSLPTADAARENALALNEALDKAGFDAYLNELMTRVAAAKDSYSVLNEDQKALAGDIGSLTKLEEFCIETVWQQLPVLDKDGAMVSALSAQLAENDIVKNRQTVPFAFQVEMLSYTEESYSEGRVKLEFVLPLTQQQAAFDLEAMPWLEEAEITSQIRLIGETEIECQVLTGYKRVKAATMNGAVIPGSFTESAAVKVLDMEHNDKLSIWISAAMEHNQWDGICQNHETAEKLQIQSQTMTVSTVVTEQEQQAEYDDLLAQYNDLVARELSEEELEIAAQELWNKISQSYLDGLLAEEAFADLSEKADTLTYGDLNAVAETSVGNNWQLLRDSGWFEEYSRSALMFAANRYTMASGNASTPVIFAAGQPSDVQIRNEGGEAISDENAVYVSKTIAGTDIENVFDITLDIVTQDIVTEVYKEPDMAVVIVMDISQTMNSNFGGTTRYKAAMTAAENFLDQFAANNLGASNVGFVAFNTDAHQIFAMSPCSTTAQATALKNTMRTATGAIINAAGYEDAHNRFTNIEGGLKRAYDLLNTVNNEHKYIVFLSDGFPTTYLSSGYSGYDPYDSAGSRFYDSVELYNGKKRPCTYGTSYSDEAAIRARKMATTLKNNGTTIFSVGVDIGGQTIKYYVDSFAGRTFAVVDRRNTNYEIGSADDSNAFKNWLGYSIGSGAGYYYDSTNSAGLSNAFTSIFEQIKELNAQSSHLDWVATDPMPDMGVHELEAMEFIGFFDRDGVLVEGDLVGVSGDGWNYENTATFDEATSTIRWDLKNSGYISTAVGSMTNYECSLTYRVRLKNENLGFEEYNAYDTNDVTSLTYRVIDKTGERVTVSEQRTVYFPIPAVEGYLAQFSFDKLDSYGRVVAGAEFTLSHDTANCGYCRGDGAGHVTLADMTATSGTDGKVSFTNIPSGHTYTLTETKVPDGYQPSGNSFQVTVAYDELTVTVTDQNGNEVPWDELVVNYTAYKLPETGGGGTSLFTFGGLLVLTAACVYFVIYTERKYRKGGANRKT